MPADLPVPIVRTPPAAFDELPDGVLVLDQSGKIETANRALAELLQRKREELVGQRIEAITAEEDILRILGFEAVFGSDQSRDTTVIFVTSSGSQFPLLVNSARRLGRTYLIVRAAGSLHQELSDTTRWAASEQERAFDLAKARDALAAKNAAIATIMAHEKHS